jgi:hypothetical protein
MQLASNSRLTTWQSSHSLHFTNRPILSVVAPISPENKRIKTTKPSQQIIDVVTATIPFPLHLSSHNQYLFVGQTIWSRQLLVHTDCE